MTNTTSEFGKELDSLADAITFWRGAVPVGADLGISFPAGYDQRATSGTSAPGRRVHLLPVPDWRSFKAGAVQYLARCAAEEPRTAGSQVFCGDADTGRGGISGFDGTFFYGYPVRAWWIAIPWLVLVG